MPTRRRKLSALAGMAVLSLALVTPAWGRPEPVPLSEAEGPSTLCAPAGTLRGAHGQRATVHLCAGTGPRGLEITAPAGCERSGAATRYACLTSGTWSARRAGESAVTGSLPGAGAYAGPGTYEITARVHARSAPRGVDLRGTVRATLTLTAPKPAPTHRVEVDGPVLRRHSSATLTYTVHRDSDAGDGSARFGLIGEEASGVRLATDDARCVNPLIGRHPSQERLTHAVDCALTDLQPGRPATVRVHVTVGSACSTIVSKLGYWMPRGQALHTGAMVAGPTVRCA